MYEYNFSKFWKFSKCTFSFEEGEVFNTWKVLCSNRTSQLDLTLKCKKDNMIFINYVAPNGKKLHNRLWNGGDGFGEIKLYRKLKGKKELIDIIEIKNAGCEYGEYNI